MFWGVWFFICNDHKKYLRGYYITDCNLAESRPVKDRGNKSIISWQKYKNVILVFHTEGSEGFVKGIF